MKLMSRIFHDSTAQYGPQEAHEAHFSRQYETFRGQGRRGGTHTIGGGEGPGPAIIYDPGPTGSPPPTSMVTPPPRCGGCGGEVGRKRLLTATFRCTVVKMGRERLLTACGSPRRPPCGVDDVLPRSVDTRISENHDSTMENDRREAHGAHLFRMSQAKR